MPTQKLPPHSVHAERTLIGAFLIDPDKFRELRFDLSAVHFYERVYADIFAAMCTIDDRRENVDIVTVTQQLSDHDKLKKIGGPAFLLELSAEVPTASHAQQYARIVKDKALKRALQKLGGHITILASDDSVTPQNALEQAERGLLSLSISSSDSDESHIADAISAVYDRAANLAAATPEERKRMLGIRTGFTALDDLLIGLEPGDLTIIAARPAMGKTALALEIAINVAAKQSKHTTFASLEMTRAQLAQRILASQAGISAQALRTGDLTEHELQKFAPVADALRDTPLHVVDNADRSLSYLRSKSRKAHLDRGLDLLIIDYLQLLEVTDDLPFQDNRVQQVSYITRELKALARELQCPIIALSQLSRKVEDRGDKRPVLSDLRESGSIEQDADHVIMLYHEHYYNEDCSDPDLIDLYLRKNRHGPTGKVELRFDKARMSFLQT